MSHPVRSGQDRVAHVWYDVEWPASGLPMARIPRRIAVVVLTVAFLTLAGIGSLLAHEMVVKGTVAAIEASRLQVKTGLEKSGVAPTWYPFDAATKVKRGDKEMSVADAHIAVNERVVLIVDHPEKGPMKTKEIRLAAR